MAYEIKNFEHLLGIQSLSNELLKNHFSLYEGYVKNTNKLFDLMDELHDAGKISSPEFSELKRRLGWELNGMRLHELYFENLTKDFKEPDKNSELYKKLEKGYDDFEYWLEDFKGTVASRGVGWAVLYRDPETNYLINSWINEHDTGHPAGFTPLLVMDVFEHAYMPDYGTKRADYIEKFFQMIDWSIVEKRFSEAIK